VDGAAVTRRVRLRVWGPSRAEAYAAEQLARRSLPEQEWDIVEVAVSTERSCPFPRRDPLAVSQGHDYNQAWAVYPVGRGS
jgi:hypothetical protein